MGTKPLKSERSAVEDVLAECPLVAAPIVARLLALLDEVADDVGTAPLSQSLAWGQPSFRSVRPAESTPVRIGWSADGRTVSLLVHCQTTVIDQHRAAFGEQLSYDGTRGVVLDVEAELPVDLLRPLIEHALTYRRRMVNGPPPAPPVR